MKAFVLADQTSRDEHGIGGLDRPATCIRLPLVAGGELSPTGDTCTLIHVIVTGGDVARAGCHRSRGSQGTLQPVDAGQLVIRDRPIHGIPDDGGQRDTPPAGLAAKARHLFLGE